MKAFEEKRGFAAKRGLSLRRINILIVIIACVIAVVALYASYQTMQSYNDMRSATDIYISAQHNADSLQDASDYLTEQVRSFVVTGDIENVDNFFNEVEVTRRRELALEHLDTYFSGSEAYVALGDALDRSNKLIETEQLAMRVAIDAYGYELSDFPEIIRKTELSPQTASMTVQEKEKMAVQLVFGDEYNAQKEEIHEDVSRCLDALVNESSARQTESFDRLQGMLSVRSALIIVLIVMFLLTVLLCATLIVRPFMRAIDHIKNHEELPLRGSEELRFLAETYNHMYEQSRRDKDQLSYDAAHDDLTGLYNRGMFDKIRQSCNQRDIAMLIVDIDKFKEVNDTYGHDVGDRILKKVASLLQSSFRSEDYVCRIGGDEFAVIMVHANSGLTELVRGKMDRANEMLQNPDDGLPAVSLSVGAAFGDRENPTDDIYKDADTALYEVKNNGRAGCAFY